MSSFKQTAMAKKRKTKRKAKAHSYQPLEQLLQTAEPDFYGFVCWYLANRDTQRHGLGDVISLDVPDATGALHKR